MSFDKIISSSVAPRQEKIIIEAGKDKITFYANELNMTQTMRLAKIEAEQGDTYTYWVVFCITDELGQRMSYEQAQMLPKPLLKKFLDAAMRVNSQENKKKAKPKKKK